MALQLSLNTTALPHHTPILQKMFVALELSGTTGQLLRTLLQQWLTQKTPRSPDVALPREPITPTSQLDAGLAKIPISPDLSSGA